MPGASQTKKRSRPRHVAQRTCVGCRAVKPKRQLIRVVRVEDGVVEVDPTGKKSGRGTYLCKQKSCWEVALKRDSLSRALKIDLDDSTKAELTAYAETLTQPCEKLPEVSGQDDRE